MKTIITKIQGLYSFYKGKNVLETGYPWLTFGAIMSLEKILRDFKGQCRILEFGSGGSTVFLADKCKHLRSYEDKKDWYLKVKGKVKDNKNITLRYLKFMTLYREAISLPDNYYDMVILDAFSGGETYIKRNRLLPHIISKVKKGGWLIIDNYEAVNPDLILTPIYWDIYTFDMFHYSGRGTRFYKKL